jgi:chitodextrinase
MLNFRRCLPRARRRRIGLGVPALVPAILGSSRPRAALRLVLGTAALALVLGVVTGRADAAPDGLVAAYSFDENSGTSVADSSGNGRTGTIAGATWTAGHFGAGLDFDGVNDRIDLPGLGTFYDTGFTLEAWVRKRTSKSDVTVLGTWVGGDGGGPMIWVHHAAGRYYQTLSTGAANYLDSGRAPAVGAWQHLAATYDGATARFYVDGTQVATRSFTGNVGDSNVWRIGAYGPSATGFFDGTIDEVRVYNRALTAAEVAEDMATSVGSPDTVPPSAPTNLAVAGTTADSIQASWTASTDDVGVAGYYVYRDGVRLASTLSPGYTYTGLACETSYTLDVEAYDAAGNLSPRASVTAETAACDPSSPPAGLLAGYAFSEGTGTVAADTSDNGHDGTVAGATWTTGRYGSGLSFNGSSGRVDLPALGTFYDTGFTLEAWVKKRTTASDVAVLGTWVGGESGGPMIWVHHGTGRYNLTLNTGALASYLDSGRAPGVGVWQHVAATYDGIVARFYVDGAEVASRIFTGNVGDSDTWRIGAYGPGPAGFFDGEIDEVRVYGRALGPAEIDYDRTHRVGPPDVTPPTAPTDFVKSGGTATTIATSWGASSDDENVAGYRLYRDGVLVASTTETAYTFSALACTASYELGVEAFDDFENVSPRTLLTAAAGDCDTTPPSVAVTSPAAGANLTGAITVGASASDDDSVVGVRFELNGAPLGDEDTSAPYSARWDTRSVPNGAYVLTAVARDPSENVATSAPVTVHVANGAEPTTGLVAAYAFDEGAGSTAGDASGNGKSGSIVGAAWAVGRFGRALSFDGIDDRVDLTPLGTFYKTAFTYEAWAKKRTTKTDVTVLGSWAAAQDGGPMIWSDHVAGRYRLTLNAGITNYLDSGHVPTTEVWEHLAVTYDGATARFYVDGVEAASRPFTGNVGDTNVWRIGAYGPGPAGFFDGLVDEVRIYDRALTQGEIQSDMATAVGAADTTPPTMPGSFAETGNTIATISTSWTPSSDNVAVERYDLYRGGVLVDSTTSTSFTFPDLSCGTSYDLGVEAVDTAGNVSARATLTAATRDCDTTPPSVALTAPADGATVSGTITVSADAADDDAVVGVQFRLDGNPLGEEDTTAPYALSWSTLATANGAHTLTAVARDPSGNSTTSAPVTVTVDNAPVSAAGLVAAYAFDDASGTAAADATGNGNAGTVSGATWTIGRFGTALSFDGTNDWVTVADSASLDLTAGMTVEAWVLPTALGTAWRTVVMKETSGNHVYALYANRNTQVPTGEADVGSVQGATGTSALALSAWSHVAVTYDGSALRLYVNGALAGQQSASGGIRTSNGALRMGGNGIWGEWFQGRIDEVRIYDRALTQSEVAFDMDTSVASDTNPPGVASTSPAAGASGASAAATVTATFDEAMDPASIGSQTFELRDSAGALVPGGVAFDANSATATFNPGAALAFGTTYTARVVGGASGVRDTADNPLAADHTWTFTTEVSAPPILLVTSGANPFSSYTAEILRAEGLNDFASLDVSRLTPSLLTAVDVVVLGEIPLTAAEVSMLSDWVNAGGNLVALRPDGQLAGLLGLVDSGSTLANGYLLINTAAEAGAGLVGETIQYHGTADRYTLSGATSVATLYSSASGATSSPAVTVRSVGANGGQAAAFAYDLARSVVLTRQGNPAWAGQDRDGVFPIRPNDLFYGAAAGDPQPDWVNVNKIAIPQADEQQRLLANLITTMARDRKPLPRFWYLPRGEKAAVVMTGDDHALGGTAGRFDQYKAASPPGCSVVNWECVRSTSYVYPASPLTSSQATAYTADGFEVGLHTNIGGGCDDWTPDELDSLFASQRAAFASKYTGIPAPVTERTHCVAWSDYVTHAKVDRAHGVRLDTNYYHYPDTWIGNRPGFMTGSGMVMRFAELDGTAIDVYQAHTHMTDEGGQPYPATVDALLDKALGSQGYYGAFTANMHTDFVTSAGSDAILSSAQARGVPIVSAKQMLDWVDGRNASSFRDFVWDGSTLDFTIRVGTGANGLQALLPTEGAGQTLAGLSRNGTPVPYTTQTIKGIQYAVFAAQAGTYAATYSP